MVVANVGRELSLLEMAINVANADYLSFFLWNELEPRCQQRAAGSLELLVLLLRLKYSYSYIFTVLVLVLMLSEVLVLILRFRVLAPTLL